jgi:hypothetical protein
VRTQADPFAQTICRLRAVRASKKLQKAKRRKRDLRRFYFLGIPSFSSENRRNCQRYFNKNKKFRIF